MVTGKYPSLAVAERLAVFFLQHPAVQEVQLFGSTAMWGQGEDVDLIVTVSDTALARAFLETLHDAAEKLDEEQRSLGDLYGVLKALRNGLALQLLGWQDKVLESQLICWAGMKTLWNRLFEQKRYMEALEIDLLYFHEYDLFLMPKGWQTSEWVDQFLPRWPSTRPFGTIPSFRDVIAWQARKFNPTTGEFSPRQKFSDASRERMFRELQRREHISWSLRHREIKELWAEDARANQQGPVNHHGAGLFL